MGDLLLAFLAANGALLIVNGAYTWRVRQRLQRVRILDIVLSQICIQSFSLRHLPLWSAWCGTMGDINVEVSAARKEWDEG
jgi:hypothetical protein